MLQANSLRHAARGKQATEKRKYQIQIDAVTEEIQEAEVSLTQLKKRKNVLIGETGETAKAPKRTKSAPAPKLKVSICLVDHHWFISLILSSGNTTCSDFTQY